MIEQLLAHLKYKTWFSFDGRHFQVIAHEGNMVEVRENIDGHLRYWAWPKQAVVNALES